MANCLALASVLKPHEFERLLHQHTLEVEIFGDNDFYSQREVVRIKKQKKKKKKKTKKKKKEKKKKERK